MAASVFLNSKLLLGNKMTKLPESGDVKATSEFVEHVDYRTVDIENCSRNVTARYALSTSLLGHFWLIGLCFRICNPLAGIPKEVLLDRVARFCEDNNLEDKLEPFQKGALIAQNQRDFELISELTEEDKYYLQREYTRMPMSPASDQDLIFERQIDGTCQRSYTIP